MPNIALYAAGEIGLIKDIPPEEVDPRGWSDCRNVRFRDGKAMRPTSFSSVLGSSLGPPYQIASVQAGVASYWIYSSLTNLYATDGATHVDVTRASGPYTVQKQVLWHGSSISNIPVITNAIDVPQMWLAPSMSTKFQDLTAWPAGDRCSCIKPFKSFLVAMNVTRSGNPYPHLVKWSHPAIPGAVPQSWDAADPTKLAGEVELVDEFPGGIRDGGGLRDVFVIYKDNAIWGMQFTGDFNVFRFFPIFLQGGIMSKHCYTEMKQGELHFVATGDDFIAHDGQNAKSIFDRRIRSFILRTLPMTLQDNCFAVTKPSTAEVWFCFPEAGGEYPTLAAIYNWESNTCSIRELPATGISFMALGATVTSSDPWNLDSQAWDDDTTTWSKVLFSPHDLTLIGCSPYYAAFEEWGLDEDSWVNDTTTWDKSYQPFYEIEDGTTWGRGYMERTGLALVGQDRITGEIKADNEAMKLIHRVWMKGMGSTFRVSIGSQQVIDGPVAYTPSQPFTPGVTKYLDYPPMHGRFMAIKIEWDGAGGPTTIQGYDLGVEVLGQQ